MMPQRNVGTGTYVLIAYLLYNSRRVHKAYVSTHATFETISTQHRQYPKWNGPGLKRHYNQERAMDS